MPKLYFYDPGLAAYLLDIQSAEQVKTHYSKGALFESMIIGEILKRRLSQGQSAGVHFWRDKNGNEIDCLLESKGSLIPIEIKSGRTVSSDHFKCTDYFLKLAGELASKPYVVYGGTENQQRTAADVISWNCMEDLNI